MFFELCVSSKQLENVLLRSQKKKKKKILQKGFTQTTTNSNSLQFRRICVPLVELEFGLVEDLDCETWSVELLVQSILLLSGRQHTGYTVFLPLPLDVLHGSYPDLAAPLPQGGTERGWARIAPWWIVKFPFVSTPRSFTQWSCSASLSSSLIRTCKNACSMSPVTATGWKRPRTSIFQSWFCNGGLAWRHSLSKGVSPKPV